MKQSRTGSLVLSPCPHTTSLASLIEIGTQHSSYANATVRAAQA
jgi:hypothetical protein